MKRTVYYLNMLFIVCMMSFLIYQNVHKPRVLVVHSYHADMKGWVPEINIGIKRVLDHKPYNVKYHYMDTKRHTSKEFKESAGERARDEVNNWEPDVLILVDDNAQQLVGTHFLNHPEINIVYTGMNKEPEDYNYHLANNVTGMLERINYSATKDILLQLLPADKMKIFHISDHSPTSEGIHKEIMDFDWQPLTLIDSVMCDSFDDWKKASARADKESNVLLLTHYMTITKAPGSQEKVPPPEVIKWTNENSKLPGISFWMFYVQDGGGLAVALSPFEQGQRASAMASAIIDEGTDPKMIPVETSKFFVIGMRRHVMEEKLGNIQVPILLEAFARANNTYFD